MSILVPKAHQDGSQLGMHNREWSNILSNHLYSSASFVNMAKITSGTLGLEVDDRPIITSPLTTTELSATGEISSGIIGLRLNNLMKASADYNMDGNTLTGVRDPLAAGEVATKYYVDQSIQGIKWKQSTRISSQLEDSTSNYWTERTGTLAFVETGADTNVYQMTSGNAGWVYDHSSGELKWQPPGGYSYTRNPGSTGGGAPSGGALNNSTAYVPMSINYPYTYSSADVGDTSTASVTINFRQSLFDGGTGGNAYTPIQIGDRVLIKDANPKRVNGIWEFVETGSNPATWSSGDGNVTRWSLKRPLDFDHSSEVSSAAVFVEEGNNNEDSSFVVTTNTSSIGASVLGTYDINWSLFGTQQADNITIYKDSTQSNRFEVTGVLRDINDIYYNYSASPSVRLNVGVGDFLVGNGTTFVAESGNVARTSLGLGTGDSPTFTNLTLTGGELTASHLISNSVNPIILSSNLSGTVDLTVDNISADGNLSANAIASSTSITAGTTIASTQGITAGNSLTVSAGNLNVAGGNITANAGSISAQFVTASVALSASYIQLKEFANTTDFTNANGYPTQNSLYVANNALYFDGAQIGGSGGGGQPIENALFYGGNIVSDTTNIAGGDHADSVLYMRLGVSGSHLSAITDAAGRESYYQILTGSFQELTGTKVDINGGTIDGVTINNSSIGLTTAAAGTFTTLIANSANITTAKILGGEVTGSYGNFTVLTGSSVDIAGGTIDGTVIGSTSAAAGTFTTLNANTSFSATTADIDGGTIDGTVIGSTSAAAGTFSTLTVESGGTLNSDNVNLTGGFINNVTIGSNSTIQASTVDYGTGSFYTLTASNIVVPQSSESGYLNITVSDTSRASTITKSGSSVLNITATKGIFDTLTGSNVKITNANILDGDITGSLGVFSVLTGSSVEIASVDINSGSLDDISIGNDLSSTNHGRFNTLTGSVAQIGEPGNTYQSYGKFLTLSASHVEIIDPDYQNSAVFEHLTGSYIEVKNQLSASAGASIGFGGNVIGDLGTPNSSDAHRKAAVNREYIDTVVAIKTSVKLAQNNAIDISVDAESSNPDSVDSVQLSLGDRILLTNQSTASENGIWQVTTGALIRPYDYASGDPAGGYIVLVEEGNSNSQSVYSLKSSGNVDASDVTVTKISSRYGVSTDGKGLKKSVNIFDVDINEGDWDVASPEARANLTFNGTSSPYTNQLILSSSIRVDELKVANTAGTSGKVQISGSNDSYIDNVKIGMNTAASGKFSSLNISTGKFELDNTTEITASAGSTNTKIGLNEATFNKITIPNTFTADNTSAAGEDLVNIIGSLKISNTQPSDTSQRLWRASNGDLYFENDKIGSAGGTSVGNVTSVKDFTSIYVTGSQADGHGAYISGTLVVEGDVQIQGSTTTISSSNTTFQDSIIGLGITGSDASSESFNNLGDRGIIFARGANQYDALPGMWWDGSKFNFAKSLTSPASGSFGNVTERSKVNAGIVEATEVTASIGLKINDYNLPTSDGNANQVIQTDGSGNLSFVNQDGGVNNTLTKIDLTVTTAPSTTLTNEQAFDLNNQIPDIFNIDLSGLNLTDFAPSSTSGAIPPRYLSIKFNNLPASFFTEAREFYIGLSGLDFTGYQTNNPQPHKTKIGWSFNDNNPPGNVGFIPVGNGTADYVPKTLLTDINGNIFDISSAASNKHLGIYWPFTSGRNTEANIPYSLLLDRVDTDGNGIFCLKYKFIKEASGTLRLEVDYSKIIYFNKFDVRFS